MWTYEFAELGGYDSLSSAFYILDDGIEVFKIDTAHVNNWAEPEEPDDTWEDAHRRSPQGEAMAIIVVRALNTIGKFDFQYALQSLQQAKQS